MEVPEATGCKERHLADGDKIMKSKEHLLRKREFQAIDRKKEMPGRARVLQLIGTG